jgi:hypothetical protein
VFLEHATWNALCDIARERDCTVDDLCLNIGNEIPDANFTQAARYYVCANSPRQSPDRDEAWRGIAGDRCCGRCNQLRIRDLSQSAGIADRDPFVPTARSASTRQGGRPVKIGALRRPRSWTIHAWLLVNCTQNIQRSAQVPILERNRPSSW